MEVLANYYMELIYTISCMIYLWGLNALNTKLYALGSNPFIIVSYDNYKPLYYFAMAVMFFVIGIGLIVNRFKIIVKNECEYTEILLNIGTIIIMAILLITIIVFINNPILRAVITIIAGMALFAWSRS